MSLREHFNFYGEPKKRRTKEAAEDIAAVFNMNAYECTFCGFWHVGSKDRNDE